MIYTQDEICRKKKIVIDEVVEFDKKLIDNASLVKSVAPAKIKGTIEFDQDKDIVVVNIDIEAKLVCLSSLALTEVNKDVKTNMYREYSFDPNNKDLDIILKKELNLAAEIYNEILFKIPMKVEGNNDKIVKQGTNWSLVTEEELSQSTSDEIDPRFAKLKEYIK